VTLLRLGVDIGGSTIRLAAIDTQNGSVVSHIQSVPMPKKARPEQVFEILFQSSLWGITSGPVGVGFPSVVINGQVCTATNIDQSWLGLFPGVLLEKKTGRQVVFMNDADAAGTAEMYFGSGRGAYTRVVVLTFGTGIGSALFVDGHLWPNTELGKLRLPGTSQTDGEVWASARTRHELNLDWSEWALRLNTYLAVLHSLLWPELIIVGGSVIEHASQWVPLLRSPSVILPAALGGKAGVVGAALIAAGATMTYEKRDSCQSSS